MHPRAAELFMAFLACLLASTSSDPMEPVSDAPRHLELYEIGEGRGGGEARSAMRDVFLQELLPTVDQEVDLSSLRRFKDRNGQRMLLYRSAVESALSRVLRVIDPMERAAAGVQERSSLRDQQDEVESRLAESGWKVGTAWSLLGVAAGVADAPLGSPPLGAIGHGLLGAAAFAITRMRRRGAALRLPLAYGAILGRRARQRSGRG